MAQNQTQYFLEIFQILGILVKKQNVDVPIEIHSTIPEMANFKYLSNENRYHVIHMDKIPDLKPVRIYFLSDLDVEWV